MPDLTSSVMRSDTGGSDGLVAGACTFLGADSADIASGGESGSGLSGHWQTAEILIKFEKFFSLMLIFSHR